MLEDIEALIAPFPYRLADGSTTAFVLVQAAGIGGRDARGGGWSCWVPGCWLTNAGLGCPDWPGCYGHIYPNAGHGDPQTGFRFGKALHEMIHRYFAGTLVLVITILLVFCGALPQGPRPTADSPGAAMSWSYVGRVFWAP